MLKDAKLREESRIFSVLLRNDKGISFFLEENA